MVQYCRAPNWIINRNLSSIINGIRPCNVVCCDEIIFLRDISQVTMRIQSDMRVGVPWKTRYHNYFVAFVDVGRPTRRSPQSSAIHKLHCKESGTDMAEQENQK